ncbi:disease resistance protein Pik-2-like isoform X2 [Triticum urartu]|uniref:disease resistance protein Pik-2-like isoform X2 n=1 Tax=Triticum urartu TaxID=4572 RepID=UPI002042C6D8|nr:disease resistance protein Pik-2-like isoform X2 [Triticum urartu]
MEVPCLLFLKSACQCVVNQVTSSAGKEIALQEGVVNDAKFLSEELEEMLKYLVNVERDEASEVVDVGSSEDVKEAGGWVDKIRDTACDIHDCLQDLGPHGVEGLSLQNLWWATLASRHKVAAELKDLVSQVSRLSERKERYQRAGGRMVRRPAVWKEEAWLVVPDIDWRVDLGQLLARPDDSLVVIAVWLMTDPAAPAAGGARAPCLISDIFDDAERFQCRAWVTATHSVSVTDFLRALVRQLLANDSAPASLGALCDTEAMGTEELMKAAEHHLGEKRYLVVIEDVCTRPVWDWIKLFFPNDRNRSRLIVTSRRADVARHCAGRPTRSFMLERVLDDDARVYVSSDQVFQHDGLIELCGPMVDHANHIIEKCDGNLLAIRIVSGLLGTKIRKSTEWEKLLNRLSSMLKDNPDLGIVSAAAKLSYDDLPSHMKYLLQYLSIFPRGRNLMRRRLARAWIAETYCRNARGYDAEEVEKIFNGLVMMSMIHPSKRAEITSGRINGCIVDDVFQQLGVSDAKLRDFIYILDEHPLDTNPTNSKIRHLVITVGWRRHDDERIDEFKKLDLSCARSLTVCGEWKSCFISTRMKLLRVLDLEDTEGLEEHHDLEQIGEFRHLKCLGLRNTGIAHLPNSLGKLLGLEELDIKGTYIAKLPSTVIHLTRLRRLHGGTVAARNARLDFVSEITRDCPGIIQSAASSAFCMCLLCLFKRKKPYGVRVPEKIGELKSVLTLGTIDVAGSRRVMKELQKLTQLQKLGVTGVTKHNTKHLCSTLERLHQLRSLMVDSSDSLSRLDTVCSPPLRLEALKLYGSLGTLPRWIKTLHNLHKLCLRSTLLDGDSVQVIAKLPNLIVLRLLAKSLVAEAMEFGSDAFPKLELLQIDGLENLMSLSFQGGAAPNLEILQIADCNFISEDGLRQFHDLPRIKKVSLDGVLVQKRPPHTSIPQGQAALVLNAGRRMRHTQAHVIRAAFRFKEAARRENSEIQE